MTSRKSLPAYYRVNKMRRGKRVPVVLQMNAVECGAACLAMILSYYGRETRLAECRSTCEGGREGVTAQTLVRAAHEYGLRARAFAIKAEGLAEMGAPAILYWNANHFVVLEAYSEERIEIVDPATGRRVLKAQEFHAAFSEVVLTFEPAAEFEERANAAPSLLLTYLKRAWQIPGTGRLMAQIIAASIVMQAFGFTMPLFTKVLVDGILPTRGLGMLSLLGAGAICVALAGAATNYCRSSLLIRLEARTDEHLMLGFFEHLLALPFRFFQQRNSGDLLMRLASNSSIRDALASYTTSAVLDSLLVLVFLAALLKVAPMFGLAALGLAALELAVLLGSTKHLNGLLECDLVCQAESQSCLVESLMGIGTLKAAGAEQATLTRWSGLLGKQISASAKRGRFGAKVEAASGLVRMFAPLGLLWLGGREVASGAMSLGTMFAVNALAASFLQPVGSLVMSAQRIQLAKAYLERIADVMQAEREQTTAEVAVAGPLSGGIELRGVGFKYDAYGTEVLRGVSLKIDAGQKVAIVGRTGSGKSTLAKLLLGLYTPTEGEILYDGRALGALSYPTVRRQWGAVMQDAFVFSASVRENIGFHDPKLSMSEVVRAAQLAGLHNEIVEMAMGYETRIGEGGSSLSGGQRQRLAIARALAGSPRMLLLDEATSQLDVLTEKLVDAHLNDLGCTRVVVAHRLSTVRNADLIVVMREGRVIERGRHEELMNIGGEYSELVKSQLAASPS